MSKIYIVKSSEGEYKDYFVYNEKAFLKKEDAEAYAKALDFEHSKRPHFITDEFINILRECESELPDWKAFPEGKLTNENRDRYIKWLEEQEEKQNKLLFELMYQRGQYMTKEMYDQYDEWESNSYRVWHNCEIEELELI